MASGLLVEASWLRNPASTYVRTKMFSARISKLQAAISPPSDISKCKKERRSVSGFCHFLNGREKQFASANHGKPRQQHIHHYATNGGANLSR